MSLNLYTPADGILKTHITWEEIESEVQEALKTQATFGEKKDVVNLSFGKGFLSRIAKITPDWQNVKDGEKLPEFIIVKIASLMNGVEMLEALKSTGAFTKIGDEEYFKILDVACKKLHNIECSIYEYTKNNNLVTSSMPQIFGLKSFDETNPLKAYMIMNYIPSDDVNLYENIEFDDLKQVLKAVAEYSAIGQKMDETTKAKYQTRLYSEVFAPHINDDTKKEAFESIRKFDNGSLEDILEEYEKVCMEAYTVEKIHDLDHLSEKYGMKPVLVHGDLHCMNLMWKRDDKGKLHLKAVIDYQLSHFNCAALDLTRLIITTLSGKDRREYYEEMIETYYKYFVEALDGEPAPYTLEQLKKSCDAALPWAAMMMAPVVQPLYDIVSAQNPGDKTEVLDRIREKVRCMIEDAISYYKKLLKE